MWKPQFWRITMMGKYTSILHTTYRILVVEKYMYFIFLCMGENRINGVNQASKLSGPKWDVLSSKIGSSILWKIFSHENINILMTNEVYLIFISSRALKLNKRCQNFLPIWKELTNLWTFEMVLWCTHSNGKLKTGRFTYMLQQKIPVSFKLQNCKTETNTMVLNFFAELAQLSNKQVVKTEKFRNMFRASSF